MNLVSTAPKFKTELLSPEPQRDPGHQLTFFLPYIVTFLFYIVILGSSSMMLNSITNEKSNRVIEILLTSITPMQLLSGKIVALGLVGLLQTIVWSGTGLFILRLSGRSFALPIEFQLPTSILVWGIIFFILGYILYASLMAGVGALVSNLKEASQATTILVIPMVIPLVLLAPVIQNPNWGIGNLSKSVSFYIPCLHDDKIISRECSILADITCHHIVISFCLLDRSIGIEFLQGAILIIR